MPIKRHSKAKVKRVWNLKKSTGLRVQRLEYKRNTGFLYARAAEMVQTLYLMQKERASQKIS